MEPLSHTGAIWTGERYLPWGRLVWENETILAVEELAGGRPGYGCPVLITPPFVDAHVHLRSRDEVRAAGSHGVLGLRDMGSRGRLGLSLASPWIRSAGAALCPPGGYGGFLGTEVDNPEEARVVMTVLKGRGASFVKLIGSGLVSFDTFGVVGPGGFPRDDMAHIIEIARELGLAAAVHVNGDEAIRNAIAAGARFIEHGFYVEGETLNVMEKHGVFWIPTVYPVAYADCSGGGSPVVKEIAARHLTRVRDALERGVKVLVGTDAGSPGVPFGQAVLGELRLWCEAGIPLERILGAATVESYKACGLPGGILSPGAPATFVVIEGLLSARPVVDSVYVEGSIGRIAEATPAGSDPLAEDPKEQQRDDRQQK